MAAAVGVIGLSLGLWGTALAQGAPGEHDGPPTNARPEAGQPYYAVGIMLSPNREPLSPEFEAKNLKQFLKQRDLDELVYTDPDGVRWRILGSSSAPKMAMKDLPPVVMVGIIDAVKREQPGVETDLLLRERNGWRTPMSLTWDLDGSLEVTVGRDRPMAYPEGPTEAVLTERFGVELRVQEGAEWEEVNLGILWEGLDRLDDEELACIRDVPIVRAAKAAWRSRGSFVAGFYTYNLGFIELQLFALDGDRARTVFFGSPYQPVPVDVRLVVHELGHAIAAAHWRRQMWALMPLLEPVIWREGERVGIRQPPDWEAFLRDRSTLPPERLDEVERGWLALHAAGWTPERVEAFRRQMSQPREVELAFAELVGERWMPSRYASSDVAETFAEFFAYWKVDPEAMRRVYPDVAAMFDSGAHLAGCRAELEGPLP